MLTGKQKIRYLLQYLVFWFKWFFVFLFLANGLGIALLYVTKEGDLQGLAFSYVVIVVYVINQLSYQTTREYKLIKERVERRIKKNKRDSDK